jgi:hypothetical protein
MLQTLGAAVVFGLVAHLVFAGEPIFAEEH